MPITYDWEKFQTAYAQANEFVKALVDSTVIPQCVQKIISEYSIPPELQPEIIVLTTNKILGLSDETETLNFLLSKQLPLAQAQAIVTALDSCLFEYSDAQRQSAEVELAEKKLDSLSISPVRTIASDKATYSAPSEPVYSSTQAAILREGRGEPVSPLPPPPRPPAPTPQPPTPPIYQAPSPPIPPTQTRSVRWETE